MKAITKITLIFALLITGANFSTALAQTDANEKQAKSDDARIINIKGTDNMQFDVELIEATAGEEITIVYTTISNFPKQAMAHNVVVLEKDADVQAFANASARARDTDYIAEGFEDDIIAATGLAGGGETVEVTFTIPDEAGDYEYICSFPGHYGAGMKGILKVTQSKS